MNRVVHFEIHADDIERARAFYTEVFGWEISQWSGMDYWMVMTAPKDSPEPGINGGLLQRPAPIMGMGMNAFVCTIQVEDIDAIIAKLEAHKCEVAMSKFAFPGMAWQAYYKDTEGNVFGIHQADANAK
ncbi:MAG: VOC family protein [Patescibacteria group bacterium]